MAPWNGSGDFSLSDTIAPATNADANELQAILTDIGVGIDASIAANGESSITGAIKFADGTAAAPALTYVADLDSGFYRIGANNIGLSLGGTKRVDFLTTGISITGTLTASGQILSSDGTKTAPGYSFSGDVDTGVYRIGANNIGVSCGDTKILDVATTGMALTGLMTISSTLGVTGDLAVNTNKFTVTAASGNTLVAGTLNVTGVITGRHTTPTTQKFTAAGAGTYTPNAGMTYIIGRIIAGGAGGGARTTNAGNNGSETVFADWHAAAGAGGSIAGAGGAGGGGGADGTGTLIWRVLGQNGGISTVQTDATGDSQAVFTGGIGGNAGVGGGAAPSGGGAARTNSGGGGSGGNSSVTVKGGGGGGGGEYVEFIMTAAQVGASKTYTVGAKGTGGGAGGSAGTDGADGIIVIVEFYS